MSPAQRASSCRCARSPRPASFKHTLNDEVEDKWARWCEDPTVDGIGAFADVEHLLCESLPQDGCYLVRLVTGFRGNEFRFAIQVLDADQLDHTYNRASSEWERSAAGR
jgi:capsid protein